MPAAINAGIRVLEYYELTFAEVAVVIQAYNDKDKRDRQNEAMNTYMLADLTALSLGRLLDSKARYPEIREVYPHLFEGELDSIETGKPKQQDWRIMKARLQAFAEGRQDASSNKKKGV